MRHDRFDVPEKDYRDWKDPRDHFFEFLDNTGVISREHVVDGVSLLGPAIDQLLVLEFAEKGWLTIDDAEGISLTEAGEAVSDSRLDKWPSWGEAAVRPDAPALPPMNPRLRMAIEGCARRAPDEWPGKLFKEFLKDA